MEEKTQNIKNKQNKKPNGSSYLTILAAAVFAFVVFVIFGMLVVSKMRENNIINSPKHCDLLEKRTHQRRNNEKEKYITEFKNHSEIKKFLKKGIEEMEYYIGDQETYYIEEETAKSAKGRGYESASSVSKDFSTTNVQVKGVDEGDIVKTDGKYIYIVSGNEIVIARAYPAESSEIISRIKLDLYNSTDLQGHNSPRDYLQPDYSPKGIYINADKLVVYGSYYDYGYYSHKFPRAENNGKYKNSIARYSKEHSKLEIFDISDKRNPKKERSLEFEGSYQNSRLIGNYVYFVTAMSPMLYNYYDDIPVPMIMENGKVLNKETAKEKNKKVCEKVYYFNIPYKSYNFTTVASVDISNKNKKICSKVYLLDAAQNNMFVSKNNIYITFNKKISENELIMEMFEDVVFPMMGKEERDKINQIKTTKNYILSPREKMNKIMSIVEKFGDTLGNNVKEEIEKLLEKKVKQKYEDISKELEKTVVHRISINGSVIKYQATGEVPGEVLNQFSMDENSGYFRIATTKNRMWTGFQGATPSESYNNIYILDKNMKTVGKVEGLAKNERIYSVRFMQNRAYMVTFRQTDPLFVVDLKNPRNPKVLGKLKIPGFSNYLHPYDDKTLIGIGKDSGDWDASLKLSLFDVSDVENPREIDNYVVGGKRGNSIALRDHKAFLFSKEKNLLVIPASYESYNDGYVRDRSQSTFVKEAAVFNVDKNGFNLKGSVYHYGGYAKTTVDVKRSLYIGDVLYTLSDAYLKANKLDNLEEIKSLELK